MLGACATPVDTKLTFTSLSGDLHNYSLVLACRGLAEPLLTFPERGVYGALRRISVPEALCKVVVLSGCVGVGVTRRANHLK